MQLNCKAKEFDHFNIVVLQSSCNGNYHYFLKFEWSREVCLATRLILISLHKTETRIYLHSKTEQITLVWHDNWWSGCIVLPSAYRMNHISLRLETGTQRQNPQHTHKEKTPNKTIHTRPKVADRAILCTSVDNLRPAVCLCLGGNWSFSMLLNNYYCGILDLSSQLTPFIPNPLLQRSWFR